MMKILKPRCEYMKDPVGMDVRQPRISWQLASEEKSVMQKSYRIQVSKEDRSFKDLVWDTGLVISDRSVHICFEGKDLEPCTRYHYRIRIQDNKGNESSWSEPAFWETGLLDPENFTAEWITAQNDEACPYLRKEFHAAGKISSARIYATALGVYELHLNGSRVADRYFAPGWTNYKKRLQYQTYDVTDMLKDGENAMGAVLGNGWYKGELGWNDRKCIYGDKTALLLQLQVKYTDGKEDTFISDTGWKSSAGPILMSELYHGETYDARLEMDGWDSPGFDDSGWAKTEQLEYTGGKLVSQESEPVRIIEELTPIGIIHTPKGETVIDFGQNMVGYVRFSVNGPKGSEVILKHAEVFDKDGNFYTGNLRKAKQSVEYILKGCGTETFQPHFTFQGFRYAKLESWPGTPKLEDFKGMVLHSDLEVTGYFRCSDELVNKLQHNIRWSQKGNFLDIPTDCPQRDERLGWTGDAQVFIGTACYNMDSASFFTKWLRDLYSEQTLKKGIPFVIPDIFGEGNEQSSSAWGDAAAVCPWTVYRRYGDTRVLEEQYESIRLWVEFIRSTGDNEYLWNTGFHFGDWLSLDAKIGGYIGTTPTDLISTAYYAYSTDILSKAAGILGKEEDRRKYSELYGKILENFRNEFISPNGRIASPTQTAHVLALVFDLMEEKDKKRTIDTLARMIEENKYHLETGFVGTAYLCQALSENGRSDLAYRLLLQKGYPSWLSQITKGATTMWEHWDNIKEDGSFWDPICNSFNHYAYGSIGDWLYRTVGGIREGLPGYKQIFIKPVPGDGLDFAETVFQSMYGEIRSYWSRKKDKMEINITVPANTGATVTLPFAKDCVLPSEAVNISESAEGLTFDIGSGKYCFEYDIY